MLGIAQHCNKISLYQQRRDEQHVLSYFSLKTDKWITLNDGNANGKEFYNGQQLAKAGGSLIFHFLGSEKNDRKKTVISEKSTVFQISSQNFKVKLSMHVQ